VVSAVTPPQVIVRSFYRVKSFLVSRGSRPADAEDVLQEAFIKMQLYHEKGGRIRDHERFLARTAARLAINVKRDAHAELYMEWDADEIRRLVDTNPRPDEVH
jgi:DNA-directed RNA polymerase specialized sigma24 family protein